MENLDTISSRNFVRIQVRGGSNSSYSLVKDSHPLASLSDGEEDHILSWTEGLTWDELFDFIASQEEVPLTCPKEELEADDLFAIYNNKIYCHSGRPHQRRGDNDIRWATDDGPPQAEIYIEFIHTWQSQFGLYHFHQ